ncbi:hypothetical protein Ddye_023725 [Dipteronia dyeriana]|uniref:2-(3-amino-3-carboxypropyl)histidine synthase subunit 2 n=1 Tax=Dipteronia dyeriana TaxID=168575 RepID=A0AAD9TTH1_9ROSI|nr:hypothetical protein Ddye_023725 [Dipteronia dyeriana]
MELETNYEISSTADFIHTRNFTRVALQFPDNLLKDSIRIVRALRAKLRSLRDSDGDNKDVGLFVMADTTYGSCCVDEVGASHIDADCVIHYGHTCLSPTTKLPAFFVFGKASISISKCVENLLKHALTNDNPVLVLYGLEYAYAIPHIREALTEASTSYVSGSKLEINFASVICSVINPAEDHKSIHGSADGSTTDESFGKEAGTRCAIGGLNWNIPEGHKMEDYLLFWIGSDNSAFANVVFTFNGCEIVRYDATEDSLVTDVSQQLRILKRRYYLVEKAKDANIIGILVGTLGVAGYLDMIHQMREFITRAGKKAYTLVMGRPNPAKLANFPECDVFITVSCAQTALLDSKEFFSPVITPFEAMLAFNRGSQWTGAYVMEFQDLIRSLPVEVRDQSEARFSFIKSGYIEDFDQQDTVIGKEDKEGALALENATEKALKLNDGNLNSIIKGTAKSGAEFFLSRSYHGLDINGDSSPEPYVIGRSGKASGYEDEKSKQES